MLRFNSSISSSEKPLGTADLVVRRGRRLLSVALWTIGGLILLDVSVGFIASPPTNPQQAPSSLQAYFDYGRSIEGKLRRELGPTAEQDAPILKAGWLPNECDRSTSVTPGKLDFDIYGMSFSNRIADRMERLDSGVAGDRFAGPEAPPNHSYACFLRRHQANYRRAPVQIMGILTSSIRRIETVSGLTTSFEGPQPFTYPRYTLAADGHLDAFMPSIATEDNLRAALASPEEWRVFRDELAKHDAFYISWIFQTDVFDHSVLTRLVRRGLSQHALRDRTNALGLEKGFAEAPNIAPVLRAILIDFAEKARSVGEKPIVILIEDHGYGTALSSLVAPTLVASHVEFIATSAIASPEDSANFLADGHFSRAVDEKIARELLIVLGRGDKS